MAVSRPTVNVYDINGEATREKILLPAVFAAPIRTDIVQSVHGDMKRNRMQPHGVSEKAGHQTSAESWGTGRAVARIPRVRGSGTHRSGQGAIGNMCRKGRMFAPIKVSRRWHRRINLNQRRYAMCSAIAGSGVTALVMAKGHVINEVPELPLVIDDSIEQLEKTRDAVTTLKKIGAYADVERVYATKRRRSGRGKFHRHAYKMKAGPCVIYSKDDGLTKAFRNIPGVHLLDVERLNLTRMACGGAVGRFCIWSKSAFSRLDSLYGTWTKMSEEKKNYNLPVPMMFNTDLSLIIQNIRNKGVMLPRSEGNKVRKTKKNPLKNMNAMLRLNPYAAVTRRQAIVKRIKAVEDKPGLKKRRAEKKQRRIQRVKAFARLAAQRKQNQGCVGVSTV